MDKSRQQFEEALKNGFNTKHLSLELQRENGCGTYRWGETERCWEMWQASRESAEPEIKHHQLRELVNTARDTAIKYQGCQCLRSALEVSIRNSLTSNGVKIKDE